MYGMIGASWKETECGNVSRGLKCCEQIMS